VKYLVMEQKAWVKTRKQPCFKAFIRFRVLEKVIEVSELKREFIARLVFNGKYVFLIPIRNRD
jgi:hypothetical protein